MEGSPDRGVSFWGERKTLHIVLAVITFGFWLLVLLALYLWRKGRKGWSIATASVAGLLVLFLAIGLATPSDSGNTTKAAAEEATTTEQTSTEVTTTAAAEPKANVYIVASKSFCTATGIDDAYTGDGHVQFWLTIRNSGNEKGTIDITPVRYYDDGTDNRSALDMVSVDVEPGQTWKGKTTAMKYSAHSHELTRCAALVGDNEIEISVTHL
jgi:hypothetical protein